MSSKDSIKNTVIVALTLCIVCSLVVSSAAVLLKPMQETNKALDRKRNILAVADLLEPGQSVDQAFEQVTPRVVNLETGEFTDEIPVEEYDRSRLLRSGDKSTALEAEEDIGSIKRREDYAMVYLVRGDADQLQQVILPVRGYGLWSTLYGFLALESDLNTVSGIVFYEHGETPGLGGEVDNPRWKQKWEGKEVYRDGEVALEVVKGSVDPEAPNAEYRVDGLSGATLTGRGVSNLIEFWMGEMGYQTFLEKLRKGDA